MAQQSKNKRAAVGLKKSKGKNSGVCSNSNTTILKMSEKSPNLTEQLPQDSNSKVEHQEQQVHSKDKHDDFNDFNDLDDSEDSQESIAGIQEENTSNHGHSVVRKIYASESVKVASEETNVPKKHIIYIGRIPHGFYEKELRKYFTQFGEILNLRVSRNKKTGNSKHYGFIEFLHQTSAAIAAETMNNYLLFGHLLRCQVVQGYHPNIFKDANKRFYAVLRSQRSRELHDRSKTVEEWSVLEKMHNERREKKRAELKEKGFDFSGFE